MVNYNFNGLNAHDIANKIIAREEAFMRADVESMSFEEKIDYFCFRYHPFHPLAEVVDISEQRKQFAEELIHRAEEGEVDAMYWLAVLNPLIDKNVKDMLFSRAYEAGQANAIMRRAYDTRSDAEKIALYEEALAVLLNKEQSFNDLFSICHCYKYLSDLVPEESERYSKLAYDLALKLVQDGHYFVLTDLKTYTSTSNKTAEENDFWKTVHFLVDSYFYDTYSVYFMSTLGTCLINGLGCEIDLERAKRFYMDVWFREEFERALLLERLGIAEDSEDTIAVAERAFRADADRGEPMGYVNLVALGILRGDVGTVERLYDEVVAKHPDQMAMIFGKAHLKVRHAK